jgi:hypothetical protein
MKQKKKSMRRSAYVIPHHGNLEYRIKGTSGVRRLTFRTSNGGFARSYPDRQHKPESANALFPDAGMTERTDLGHRLSLYIHPSEED